MSKKDAKNKQQQPGADGSGGDPEKEAWEVMTGILLVAVAGYVWWRAGHPIPFRNPLHALSLPRWLPLAGGAGIAGGLVAAVWWARRWWQQRLARKIRLALLEAGVEGRHPTKRGETIQPKIKKAIRLDKYVWKIAYEMPILGSSLRISGLLPHVEEKLDMSLTASAEGRLVWIRAGTRRLPRTIGYDDFDLALLRGRELPLSIGAARDGDKMVDLAELPHLMVGGKAGGGKSVFLRQGLVRLVSNRSPHELRMVLADLKGGMEFSLFRDLPHLMCPVASDAGSFAEALAVACEELTKRMDTFREAGVENLKAWNREHPEARMPYLVVAVDELAQVTLKPINPEEQAAWKTNLAALSMISRLGRAPGVLLILCTQRPDAEALPGQIKGNMGATVAFRAQDVVQSGILLGQGDPSANLLPADIPGRAVWKWIDAGVQIQTPLLEVTRARELIGELQRRWPSSSRRESSEHRPDAVTAPSGAQGRGAEPARVSTEPEDRQVRSEPVPVSTTAASRPLAPAIEARKPSHGFDLTRLKLGAEYEFHLRNGRSVRGTVRAIDFEPGRGGANADGEHPLWVSGNGQDHWLSPRDLAQAKRVASAITAKETSAEET